MSLKILLGCSVELPLRCKKGEQMVLECPVANLVPVRPTFVLVVQFLRVLVMSVDYFGVLSVFRYDFFQFFCMAAGSI